MLKSENYCRQNKNDSLAAYSLLGIAVYNYNTSRYDDAIETAIKALKLLK